MKNIYKNFIRFVAFFLAMVFLFLNFIVPIKNAYSTRNMVTEATNFPIPKERSYVIANLIFDNFPELEKRIKRYYQLTAGNVWFEDKTKPLDKEIWAKTRLFRGFAVNNFISMNSYEKYVNGICLDNIDNFSKFIREVRVEEYQLDGKGSYMYKAVKSALVNSSNFDKRAVVEIVLKRVDGRYLFNYLVNVREVRDCLVRRKVEAYSEIYTSGPNSHKLRDVYFVSANLDDREALAAGAYLGECLYQLKDGIHKEIQFSGQDQALRTFLTVALGEEVFDEARALEEIVPANNFVNRVVNAALQKIEDISEYKDFDNEEEEDYKVFVLRNELNSAMGEKFIDSNGRKLKVVGGAGHLLAKAVETGLDVIVCIDGKYYIASAKEKPLEQIKKEGCKEEVTDALLDYMVVKSLEFKEGSLKEMLVSSKSFYIQYLTPWLEIVNFLNLNEQNFVDLLAQKEGAIVVIPDVINNKVRVLRIIDEENEGKFRQDDFQKMKIRHLLSAELASIFTEKAKLGFKNKAKIAAN